MYNLYYCIVDVSAATAAAFFGTTVRQVSLRQTAGKHRCQQHSRNVQRHLVDSRSEEGSSGCQNVNKR